MAMITVYVDDSGTHDPAKVAAAACCLSSVSDWRRFERAWLAVGKEEGFKHFHMSEFAACRSEGWCRDCKKGETFERDHPWREWSMTKRKRVIRTLGEIICKHIKVGAGWAIVKSEYDSLVPPELRKVTGDHYTYAFSCCGGQLRKWRAHQNMTGPMEFVFDLMPHKVKEGEIAAVFMRSVENEAVLSNYGISERGYSFKNKRQVVQLLSADTLAYATVQETLMSKHIRDFNCIETKIICGIFERHRPKTVMGYQTAKQLEEWVREEMAFHAATGKF